MSNDHDGRETAPAEPWLIELHSVVKEFQTPAGTFTALKSIDLHVDRGEFVAVIGKSGSGKSTLINMITGIDRPTAGSVMVDGMAVNKMSEGQIAQWRGRNVGVVFQFFQLLPTLSLIENVMLPMDFCHTFPGAQRYERAMHLLDLVDMADQAHKLPAALSGGQQQRVAIARALANDPPIIVADEPTGNLDSKTAESVFRLFEDLVDQGKTILMVTHDHDLAKRVMRAVIVSDGEIIDQYLAQTFPSLTSAQLIAATHSIEPHRYESGQVIMREGAEADRFYIITRGQIEVVLTQPNGQEVVVNRMGSGQYFGEVELLHGGARIATIRAAASGVDVVSLDRAAFSALMASSEPTLAAVDQVADERELENQTARA